MKIFLKKTVTAAMLAALTVGVIGLLYPPSAGGEVNTLSTVPEQMAQIMDEWRAAQ